jgi:hypothetical protein
MNNFLNSAMNTNILFNALKHHQLFICRQITIATSETLPGMLKLLGNSQMDVYYGTLDLPALFEEVAHRLQTEQIVDEATYLNWLQANNGYVEITLSDTSRWILLAGNVPGKYVHLHPARYSPHSLRVKATVLKTAIACMVSLPQGIIPDLSTLNHIRESLLQLSPVKDLSQCEHLWKVMQLLSSDQAVWLKIVRKGKLRCVKIVQAMTIRPLDN